MIEWRWGNEGKLLVALDHILDPKVRDDLLDALDAILADPEGPAVSHMRGPLYRTDRCTALLPHLWYLVFTPYPDGVPPSNHPVLVVRDFYPLTKLLSPPPEPPS